MELEIVGLNDIFHGCIDVDIIDDTVIAVATIDCATEVHVRDEEALERDHLGIRAGLEKELSVLIDRGPHAVLHKRIVVPASLVIVFFGERLDALGDPDGAEPAGKKKMRDMFGQQLELAQDLSDQLNEAQERRARLLTMLETLWLQVSNLKAQSVVEDFDTSEISQKVRAIADDVQRYHEASEETVKLLQRE